MGIACIGRGKRRRLASQISMFMSLLPLASTRPLGSKATHST
jgi:hypothetical protein